MADTVYVSFYKGLGGLGGAIVAGSEDHVRSLAPWKTRYAGNLYTAFPHAISGLQGLDTHLPRIAEYRARARRLSRLIEQHHPGIAHPAPPHVNAFQLLLKDVPDTWRQRNRAFAERNGIWLFNAFSEAAWHGHTIAEIVIGDAADRYDDAQALGWLGEFLDMA